MADLVVSANIDTFMQAANFAAARTSLGVGTGDSPTFTAITVSGTTSLLLGTAGTSVGNIGFRNATSGTITLAPPTGALGTVTLTLPAATDTLVGKATTDTLTNKTLTSPTLTTPVLGVPSSGTLTSCTGLPISTGVSGLGTGVATFLATPSSANLITALTDSTGTGVNVFGTSPAITTSITTGSTTFALLNTTATTVNAFGAATTLNIGASATCILNFGGSTTASEFRFLEPSGSGTNYTAFKAKAQSANITYTLPDTVGAAGTYLRDVAGDGVLSWAAASGSGDVTAASNFGTDNRLIRSDGTSKGVQSTGITVDDSDNMTGLTSVTATSLSVTGQISDTNNNELIKFTATASAVNELTLANAATGANPAWSATGGDTDIGIDFTPKGAGKFNFKATSSGPAELRVFEDTDNGSNYAGIIAPASLSGNVTVTLPNASSTLPIFGQQITVSGPSTARTWTAPDADFTIARTDAANTFTGVQTMTSPSITTSVVTGSTTLAVFNTTATTVNAFGAATTLNIGASATCILNFGGSTTASEFRFLEPSGSGTNYTAFKAVAQSANITYSLPATVGGAGTFLKDVAGDGVLSWATPAGSGTVTATGGSLTANAVVLGAGTTDTKVVAGIITDGTSKLTLGVAGTSVGSVDFKNATSGTITISPPTGALGTVTLTLPAATDTLVGKATTDTLTNKTLTSPTLTTPVLGTPASGNLTSCTADGTNAVGYRNVPQNAKTGSYTLLATDVGKVVPNTTGGWTVNNSVHTAGDVVTVYNDSGSSQNITAGTITTMRLAGTATTGTRALAQRGLATLYFQTASEVVVSGAGVT